MRRSVGAVLAGILVAIVLSTATDALLYAAGVFPKQGTMSDQLLVLATVYRSAYGVAAAYLTALLAPRRPLDHAIVLGMLGTVVAVMGVVAAWKARPSMGPMWYPVTLAVTGLPVAWLGGWLYVPKKKL